jgi:hypothetical protein
MSYFKNKFVEKYFKKNVAITKPQLAEETVDQAANPVWREERKCRISASRAHKIAHARTEEKSMEYFMDDGSNISEIPAIKYGRETEPIAKRVYEQRTGTKILPAGLVVSKKHNWLCASPDGFINVAEEGEKENLWVLEIKCPYSCRGGEINVPYYKGGQGLLRSHSYFTQVQLQMYCSELTMAQFMIYSSPGTWVLMSVARDDSFLNDLIPKLEKLYFQRFLPQLADDSLPAQEL